MRLFIGLPLPPDARADTTHSAALAMEHIPGRYTLESNYHITLAFIGNVPPDRLEDVKEALTQTAARFPAPDVVLGNLSYFNRIEKAILVRDAAASPALRLLHDALCDALNARALSAQAEPFSAHVTLARHADLSRAPLPRVDSFPPFKAERAVLFLSARDGENVLRYTPLFSAPFISPRS